jgi:hypothetical protein
MRHLLFVPLTLLAASLCAFGSIDSGLLGLVPANTKTVGGFDVTNSRNSEFGSYLLAKSQMEDSHFQRLMEETGFDPRRDLQSLVFASGEPGAGQGMHQNAFAILARGTFDEQRIREHAQAEGATVQTFQGVPMLTNLSKDGEETGLAFLGHGIAAWADLPTLQQIILNRAHPSVLDPALRSRVNAVGAANDIWFAALASGDFLAKHFDAATQGDDETPSNAKVLRSIVQSSGGIKLGSTVDVMLHAITRSPQDANSLADVIHFMASMVQMRRSGDRRADLMAESLDTMTVNTEGDAVNFTMSMPEKNLEQIAELAPKGRARIRPNTR